MFKLIGPIEIENWYRSNERKLAQALSARSSTQLQFLALLLVLFLGLLSSSLMKYEVFYSHAGGMRSFYEGQLSIPLIVVLSLGCFFISDHLRVFYQMAVLFLAWSVIGYWGLDFSQLTLIETLAIFFLMPSLWLISCFFLRAPEHIRKKPIGIFLYTALFWIFIYMVATMAIRRGQQDFFLSLLRIRPDFLWFIVMAYALDPKLSSQGASVSVALNPVNGIRGELWPYDLEIKEGQQAKLDLWWSGIICVILGYTFLHFRLLLGMFFSDKYVAVSIHKIVISRYLLFLGNIASANLIVGVVRMYGMQARDATNFVFLSRTPAEYWQRIAVYNYMFIQQYLKVPLYRVLKSKFLSMFIAFGFFFFSRFWIEIVNHSVYPDETQAAPFVLDIMLFFNFFILLYVTRNWWFYNKREMQRPIAGWVSILCTHGIFIISIYFVVYLYYKGLKLGLI